MNNMDNNSDEDNNNNNDDELVMKVLKFIEEQNDKTSIRPGKLAVYLGISMDDAEAELCALLSITGCGSFRMESVHGSDAVSSGNSLSPNSSAVTMVFTFPENIGSKVKNMRRKESFYASLMAFCSSVVMFLRFLSGIGIFISIAIVAIVAVVAIIAAFVALIANSNNTRGGHGHRQLRSFFRALREFLWLYAMFGGNNGNPFFRDLAFNASYGLSMLYLSPFSPFFWINMMLINRRRQMRQTRSRWRAGDSFMSGRGYDRRNDENSAFLVREGVWGQHDDSDEDTSNENSNMTAM